MEYYLHDTTQPYFNRTYETQESAEAECRARNRWLPEPVWYVVGRPTEEERHTALREAVYAAITMAGEGPVAARLTQALEADNQAHRLNPI